MALEVAHQEEVALLEEALPEETHQEEALPEEAHQEEVPLAEVHQVEEPLVEDLLEEDNHPHNKPKQCNQYPSKQDHAMNRYEKRKLKNPEETAPMPRSS